MATAIIVDEHLTDCPLLLLPVEKSRTHGRGRAAFQTKLWEKIILLVITDGNLTLLRVPAFASNLLIWHKIGYCSTLPGGGMLGCLRNFFMD